MLDIRMEFYQILIIVLSFLALLVITFIVFSFFKKQQHKKHNVALSISKLGVFITFIICIILISLYLLFYDDETSFTFIDIALIIIEISVGVFITFSILYYERAGQDIIKKQINKMNSYQTNKEKNDDIRKSEVDIIVLNMLEIMLENLKYEKNLLFNFYKLETNLNQQKIDPEFIRLKKNNNILYVENLKNIILMNHDVIDSNRNLTLLKIITIASESYMLNTKYRDYDINAVTREIRRLQIVLTKDYGKNIGS